MTLSTYQVRPGAALVGKARITLGFGFGFWRGEPFQVKGDAFSADENPVMGRGEACSPGTIYLLIVLFKSSLL